MVAQKSYHLAAGFARFESERDIDATTQPARVSVGSTELKETLVAEGVTSIGNGRALHYSLGATA